MLEPASESVTAVKDIATASQLSYEENS